MEENQGDVMTFLVISAAIEWLEQHHTKAKELKEKAEQEKKDAAEKELTVLKFICSKNLIFQPKFSFDKIQTL